MRVGVMSWSTSTQRSPPPRSGRLATLQPRRLTPPHALIATATLQSIADGLLTVEPVLDSEWSRIAELAKQYRDLPLGMADASLVALAERHNARETATLDHRHFSVVRPGHVPSFTLLP